MKIRIGRPTEATNFTILRLSWEHDTDLTFTLRRKTTTVARSANRVATIATRRLVVSSSYSVRNLAAQRCNLTEEVAIDTSILCDAFILYWYFLVPAMPPSKQRYPHDVMCQQAEQIFKPDRPRSLSRPGRRKDAIALIFCFFATGAEP